MNLDKEREAFENKFDYINLDYVDDIGYCETETQLAWEAWQAAKAESHKSASLYQWEINHLAAANQQWRDYAAKASAVPDGFKLVSFKQISALVVAVNKVDLMMHKDQKTNEVRLAWQDIASKLQAMIEAA